MTKPAPSSTAFLGDAAVAPTQSSRAGLEVLGSMLRASSGPLREAARQAFREDPEGRRLTETHADIRDSGQMAKQLEAAKAVAARDPLYRLERFFQRFVAEETMTRNVVMAEERRDAHLQQMAIPLQGAGGSLTLDPDLETPAYYEGVHYHLSPHGVEDYDLGGRGTGIGLVFRVGGFAAVPLDSNIFSHRIETVQQLPKSHYDRILEIGCGGVGTMMAINKVFPDAELIGCDLSDFYLKNAHVAAEKMGLKVAFKQADARATGEPDASIDAVVSYAVHHEAPVAVNLEMFAEMFRVLKPGGDIVIQDPPPFRAVEPFHAAVLDWDTDHREEPYFTEACLADWDAELAKIGFVDVQSYALGSDSYPWIIRATKPASAPSVA